MRHQLLLFLLLFMLGCQENTPISPINSILPTPQPITSEVVQTGVLDSYLLVLEQRDAPDFRVSRFDLSTLETETLFAVPENGWVNQIALSADNKILALAYSPPSPDGNLILDRSGIYLLPLDSDAETLTPLLVPESANSYYYTPVWSPDSRYIFYVQTVIQNNSFSDLDVTLMRLTVASGETQTIAKDGIWPRVSPDGAHLTFIQVDPDTLERGLVVTNLDGEQRRELVSIGQYFDLDTPLFSADSQSVYFTVARENPATRRTFWETVSNLRVSEAHANHNVPSAWWRIGLDGGEAEVLSAETDIILYGAFDTTGEHLYFSTITGLYVYSTIENKTLRIADAPYFRTLSVKPHD
ncbi:MAG: hypothetical protein ACPG8W_03585 [Candidatus Promineifilaceae bacterium]